MGVFQAGVVGYMAEKDILALDGKVNKGAFEALEAGTLVRHLRAAGVTTVTDLYPRLTELMLEHGARNEAATAVERRGIPHPTRPFTWLVVALPRR